MEQEQSIKARAISDADKLVRGIGLERAIEMTENDIKRLDDGVYNRQYGESRRKTWAKDLAMQLAYLKGLRV